MRLFVAVWPPPEVADALAALPRPVVPRLRWTTADQWHVTLRFLGSVDDPDPVLAALQQIRAEPAVARLGPSTARFGDRVLHVPVAGLDQLAAATGTATEGIGQMPEDRPFAGHITLARPQGRHRVDLRPLTGALLAASWPVTEVTLVASTTLASGARYHVIGSRQVPGEVP